MIDLAGRLCGNEFTDIVAEVSPPDGMGLDAMVMGVVVGHDARGGNYRIDIGRADPAYLAAGHGTSSLRPGERGLFQIKGVPRGDKSFTLTRDITISGQMLVLVARDEAVRGGRNWTADRRSAVVAALEKACAPAGETGSGPPVGWILRSAAETADIATITAEALRLVSLWKRAAKASSDFPTGLVMPGPAPAERLLLDFPDTRTVACAGRTEGLRLSAALRSRLNGIAVVEDDRSDDLLDTVADLLEPKVPLDCGAVLHIEPTQALVAVDVDLATASDRGLVNRQAAQAVARQCRLRNLGGIIVVDLVADRSRKALTGLRTFLEECLADDPRRITGLDGPSALGLVQFARERRGAPLGDVLRGEDL